MNTIVPELHDIGKLIDKVATGIEHNLENCPTQLNTNTWRGIIEHHCSPRLNRYPSSVETFKLCIADHLAAAMSRYSIEGEVAHVFNVHKLWKPPKERLTQSFMRTREDAEDLIRFIARNPTANEFFDKYGDLLKIRTEDATAGRNITSLLTHSKLTGQFYRILTAEEENFSLKSEELQGMDKEKIRELIEKKKNEWKMSIIKCKIHFTQNPVRAKDMNIFRILENFVNELKKSFPDNVLLNTSDELLLLSSRGEQNLQEIYKVMEERGFWSEIVYAEAPIRLLDPRPEDIPGNKKETIYPKLLEEIKPPICDLCQMAEAKSEPWVEEESGIVEHLCQRCWKVREMGGLLTKFVEWEKTEKTQRFVG